MLQYCASAPEKVTCWLFLLLCSSAPLCLSLTSLLLPTLSSLPPPSDFLLLYTGPICDLICLKPSLEAIGKCVLWLCLSTHPGWQNVLTTGTELSYENILELSSGLESTLYLISNSCLQRFAKTRKIIEETMCVQLDLVFLSSLPLFSDLGSKRGWLRK